MSFQTQDTVSTYKIIAKLGSGGMGEVFQVEHLITKRVEALKILSGQAASTPEQRQRFLREIQLQAGLSHPNIAAVHNAFWENERLVMVMELIRDGSPPHADWDSRRVALLHIAGTGSRFCRSRRAFGHLFAGRGALRDGGG